MYFPWVYVGGKNSAPPTFKLTSEDGKVLLQASFTVSKEGQLTYEWRPGAFKGKYRIEISATLGPYEFGQEHKGLLFEVK